MGGNENNQEAHGLLEYGIMRTHLHSKGTQFTVAVMAALALFATDAYAVIDGLTGSTFTLSAKDGYVLGGDGLSIYTWGFADDTGPMQYPGPTLIVNQGALVTVSLKNYLPEPVSIVFPGQEGVTATGGVAGQLTQEAPADNGATTVEYQFQASEPGTYHYHSGTHMDLQVEMGLVGAIIVRPTEFPIDQWAYNHTDSAYDHEYLFLLTEMDYDVHLMAEFGLWDQIDTTTFHPVYWFINGRNFPDTTLAADTPWLPNQPYNCLPRMHPGERLLLRIIGGGRDLHPFHPHGNNTTVIAKDARLLQSPLGTGADLAYSDYTITSLPGQTVDAIFEWTGAQLGWDVYGHAPGDPMEPFEYAPDHGKPFPVILPGQQELTFGGGYSGSPFLGAAGDLPPGEGGLNVYGGFMYPWHSHAENEIINNDIFIGGMLSLLIIEPHGTPIP